MMTLRKEDADIKQDINVLRTISLSQETIRYPCFKPKIVSQAHKDPYTWNKQIFQKFEKFKYYPKITNDLSKLLITLVKLLKHKKLQVLFKKNAIICDKYEH